MPESPEFIHCQMREAWIISQHLSVCVLVWGIEESEWGGELGVGGGEFPHNLSNPLKHPILYLESAHPKQPQLCMRFTDRTLSEALSFSS